MLFVIIEVDTFKHYRYMYTFITTLKVKNIRINPLFGSLRTPTRRQQYTLIEPAALCTSLAELPTPTPIWGGESYRRRQKYLHITH